MSYWRIVGGYLGRAIRIAEISAFERLPPDQLLDSVMLVFFGNNFEPDENGLAFLESLVQQQPLAITVCGSGARKAFDSLISQLSDGKIREHTMTKLFEANDFELAIEDLLQATWPSEDRFDEWKSYSILSVGNVTARIEQAAKKFCD